jgi:hypothetical protein
MSSKTTQTCVSGQPCVDRCSLFVVSSDRLARATSALLRGGLVGTLRGSLRLSSLLGTARALLRWGLRFVLNVGSHGFARTAPSLLRRRSLGLFDFFNLLLSWKWLARTASSLLRSNFNFGFILVVNCGSGSGLLRATAAFLGWGGIISVGVSSLLALLGGWFCLLLVVLVSGLCLGGTTTLLASGLLGLAIIVAVLVDVSDLIHVLRVSEGSLKDWPPAPPFAWK